jgi:hypothetical protein
MVQSKMGAELVTFSGADDKADHHEERVCLSKSNDIEDHHFMHGTRAVFPVYFFWTSRPKGEIEFELGFEFSAREWSRE